MQNDSFDFETDEEDQYKSLPLPKDDPYVVKILDWFVRNGFHTQELFGHPPSHWLVGDSQRRCTFIEKAGCEYLEHPLVHVDETYNYQLDHLVEIATLTAAHCERARAEMDQLLAPLQLELRINHFECDYEIESSEADGDRCAWITTRFNENDFAESRLDLKMREHFVLVDRVDALLS